MFGLVRAEMLTAFALVTTAVIGGGLCLALIAYERRAPEPMLPFKLCGNPIIAAVTLSASRMARS